MDKNKLRIFHYILFGIIEFYCVNLKCLIRGVIYIYIYIYEELTENAIRFLN